MKNKKSSSEPPNLQNQSGPLPESPAPASAATQVSTQALTEAPTQASVSAQPPTPTSTKAPTPENANPKEPPSPCPGAIVVVERKQQRQVVMSIGPKNAPSFGPYDEFCPVCSKIVQTHVEYKMGASSTSGSSKITSKLEKSKIIKIDRRSRINGVKVAKYSKSYVEYCPDCEDKFIS
uniref:LITAF domain-containing protein n=1 Tax=Caenorhabditis angaria TaxID=860376 RepID=B6VBW5_9PELO|nr:hypothetical protein Csp3_JD04.007 [Caenorhabditis angaria]